MSNLVGPLVFLLLGPVSLGIGIHAIRRGYITLVSRRPLRRHVETTYSRATDPLNFWGFAIWFLLFGTAFTVIGAFTLFTALRR